MYFPSSIKEEITISRIGFILFKITWSKLKGMLLSWTALTSSSPPTNPYFIPDKK